MEFLKGIAFGIGVFFIVHTLRTDVSLLSTDMHIGIALTTVSLSYYYTGSRHHA